MRRNASAVLGAWRSRSVAERSSGEPYLVAQGIVKRFGELNALDDVHFDVRRGEVHALLGENGAGKSTLMNVVAGCLAPDEGAISISGKEMAFRAPRDALRHGIGMVHQYFSLVGDFTVAENLALGSRREARLLTAGRLRGAAAEEAARFGFDIDPDTRVRDLSVGEQQRVELLRTLANGVELLILDEPTAVLTPAESEHLCRSLRTMASDGLAIVFISHKLREVLAVADRITVMRQGRNVATEDRSTCDGASLARLMVGQGVAEITRTATTRHGRGDEPALRVEDLHSPDDRGVEVLRGVSFDVHSGEILGIAGVDGNGQRELAETVTGVRRASRGSVVAGGVDLSRANARTCIDAGVAHISEDSRRVAMAVDEPIWINAILKSYRRAPICRGPYLDKGAAVRSAQALCRSVRLTTDDPTTLVRHLSGGNLQRLVTGRELGTDPRVLIAAHPTRGLDISAIADVRKALLRAREQGVATLLISGDLDEILALSDRIIVFYEGRVAGEVDARDADRDHLGRLMAGHSR